MAVKKVAVKKKRIGKKSRSELTNLPAVHKKKYGKKGKKRIRPRKRSGSFRGDLPLKILKG